MLVVGVNDRCVLWVVLCPQGSQRSPGRLQPHFCLPLQRAAPPLTSVYLTVESLNTCWSGISEVNVLYTKTFNLFKKMFIAPNRHSCAKFVPWIRELPWFQSTSVFSCLVKDWCSFSTSGFWWSWGCLGKVTAFCKDAFLLNKCSHLLSLREI